MGSHLEELYHRLKVHGNERQYLPPKLYITMHVVGHPLNGLLIQTLVMVLPVWWMGYSKAACTLLLMTSALHGLISHFKFDVRMGFMNYLFVGTELHRYHHSSALREAKNFGAVDEQHYPSYERLLDTLKFPFRAYPWRIGSHSNIAQKMGVL